MSRNDLSTRRSFLCMAGGIAARTAAATILPFDANVAAPTLNDSGKSEKVAGAVSFHPSRLERMDRIMAGYIKRKEIPGLVTLICRNNETHVKVLGSKAFEGGEPMQRDTIFRIASISKPIVAAAAMTLVEECKIRLDDPVDNYLPELANRCF